MKKPIPNERQDLRFRLIVEEPGEGFRNMAVDEALLEAVSLHESPPVIRLYGFEPPTLSVGRFQKTAEVVDFDRLAAEGVGFVRRPTGGQSVLHTDELTYAFIVGKNDLEPFGKRTVYRFIAPLLLAALGELGLRGLEPSASQQGDPKNPDCFASTGEYEIDSPSGRKLVGSAQMVTRTAVLQHGSVPLSAKNRAIARFLRVPDTMQDHASNLSEEIGRYLDLATVREAFTHSFADHLALEVDRLRPSEAARAEELVTEKYSTEQWNRKY